MTNHLIHETSPYLLAHAQNPVNWYPWGEQALQKAKEENKLIFLSIGYHACHWCHVMEKESFEDPSVAAVLNEAFVCIKVDREERKDLDAVYMKVCQAMTGSGGWPLNVWLTPDRQPVYAGTYFPKNTLMNRPGLIETATHLSTLYKETPEVVRSQSREIMRHILREEKNQPGSLSSDVLDDVAADFAHAYDSVYGGFSRAPKFPAPHQLLYLLESEDSFLMKMGLNTLEQMIKGGIYDHIGGGFSRYSVDEKWLIPHFEKMLYDNSLLLDVLCRAYAVSGKAEFKTVTMEVKEFMKNELGHEPGGFYSAYDADSEGVEGKYYRFSKKEIIEVLGDRDGSEFCHLYGITTGGNFEGYSILNLVKGTFETVNDKKIKAMRVKLAAYRGKRVKPSLDDKILSMCNAFAIHGLACMKEVFEDEEALSLAVKAEKYLDTFMLKGNCLLASVRNETGNTQGTVDDYGAYVRALFKLFAVTQEESYLKKGLKLLNQALSKFWDPKDGGFFIGELNNPELIYNPKELYDGAIPSGNSLMAGNLLEAFLLTEDLHYKRTLDQLIACFSKDLNQYKIHSAYFMRVIRLLQSGTKELKIYVADENARQQVLQTYKAARLQKMYPHHVLLVKTDPAMCIDGLPTVHYCENGACGLPELLQK